MPNHAKWSHPWTVHTSRLLMSQKSIKNVLENLFLMFGRGKTQNRAKTHRPSIVHSPPYLLIFVLKENGTQSHSAKFLNWGDHINSVPDLAASPPCEVALVLQVSVQCVCLLKFKPFCWPTWSKAKKEWFAPMPMHTGSIVFICICILFLLHPIDNTLVVQY